MSLVIVNGLPGSGKSTLAKGLATELSLPLFSKDAIKESLADVFSSFRSRESTSVEWSQQLGLAAATCLWQMVTYVHGEAVIDSPWLAHLRPIIARELERAGVLTHHEVWCDVPLEIARERFEDRAPVRHWIHTESSGNSDADWEMWSQMAEPLGLGAVHRVDTTKPVDLRQLVQDLNLPL